MKTAFFLVIKILLQSILKSLNVPLIININKHCLFPALIITKRGKTIMYEVEAIVGKRINPQTNLLQYQVKWFNYPPEQATWETEQNLKFVKNLIEEFNRSSNGSIGSFFNSNNEGNHKFGNFNFSSSDDWNLKKNGFGKEAEGGIFYEQQSEEKIVNELDFFGGSQRKIKKKINKLKKERSISEKVMQKYNFNEKKVIVNQEQMNKRSILKKFELYTEKIKDNKRLDAKESISFDKINLTEAEKTANLDSELSIFLKLKSKILGKSKLAEQKSDAQKENKQNKDWVPQLSENNISNAAQSIDYSASQKFCYDGQIDFSEMKQVEKQNEFSISNQNQRREEQDQAFCQMSINNIDSIASLRCQSGVYEMPGYNFSQKRLGSWNQDEQQFGDGYQKPIFVEEKQLQIFQIVKMEKCMNGFVYLAETNSGSIWVPRDKIVPKFSTQLVIFYQKYLTFND